MWPFSIFAKARARKQYAKKITPALHKLYGKQKTYSPNQVKTAARRENLDIDYVCWAYCLHLDKDTFDAVHREMGEICDYVSMKSKMLKEISALNGKGWFDNDLDFNIGDFDSWD